MLPSAFLIPLKEIINFSVQRTEMKRQGTSLDTIFIYSNVEKIEEISNPPLLSSFRKDKVKVITMDS